mgnify:CR=1 FL=1
MEQEKQLTSLPENAYRELKPGEEYTPIMPASSSPREVTPYSVTMGIVMAIVFSAAAAFLGLKVGQVFEAAIPIAIIAVGMGNVMGKRNMLGQNVIIQSIGASSGVIVAGAIFTLPALYILGLDAAFYQVFLSSLFGGLLGIVLLIPFRKYFVKEMHGKYPFPEATATTEVLVSGEKGGSQAKLLAVAGLVGGLYDFVVGTFGLWTESVSTRICEWGAVAADKFKVVFGLNTSAAVLGLGYIIGLKYAMIITAGSCLVWFVIVPVVGSLAEAVDSAAMLSLLGVTRADIVADPQSIFTAENLFAFIGKPLGIGGIAMAGIIGIVKQSKIIRQAVGLAVSELGGGNKTQAAATERTQRDLTMKRILTILIATLISVFVFFHFGLLDGWVQSVTAILIDLKQFEGFVSAFHKIGSRERVSISREGLAAAVKLDENGRVEQARLSLGAVGGTPIRVTDAEEYMRGRVLDEKLVEEITPMVAETIHNNCRPANRLYKTEAARGLTADTFAKLTSRL